jgi:type I restriction enzyme S subunit
VNEYREIRLVEALVSAEPGFACGQDLPGGSGVVQLRMNNVSAAGGFDWSKLRRIPADTRKLQRYSLKPGDVVFNHTNSPDLVGKAALFKRFREPILYSNHFLRLRVHAKLLDPVYLAWWLHLQWTKRVFEGLCTQWVNQATVRVDDLLSLQVRLPSLVEQRRVGRILEQADRLRRIRRYALELGDVFLPAAFLKFFGELRRNEKRLRFGQLAEVSEIASGVTKGQKFGNRKTVEVPYLRVANVQDGFLDLSEIKTIRALPEDLETLRLKRGDVVMTEGGDFDKLGRGAIWQAQVPDCIHQNHIFRVRLDEAAVLPTFFAAFLRTAFAKDYFLRCSKQTTNLATINMTQLRATPVPAPPMSRQVEFEELVGQHERLRRVHLESLRQAEHLFQTLLHRAFTTGL